MLGKCLNNTQKRQIEAFSPEKCLAKLVDDNLTGEKKPGISVAEHCLITGFVAEELCKSLIDNVKAILTESAPFFASIHDVGKISPDFQRMIYTSWVFSAQAEVFLSLLASSAEKVSFLRASGGVSIQKVLLIGDVSYSSCWLRCFQP